MMPASIWERSRRVIAAGLAVAVEASNPAAWLPALPTPMSGVGCRLNQSPPA